ncbi:MAG TPA: cytochrome-c oxidase, cbb3-type subunit I, partial [Kiloniellaceae bacterium]|nr:cytochrome-c oxidase, cbb3-type subunit I [Kiloniellaceae bacterium]
MNSASEVKATSPLTYGLGLVLAAGGLMGLFLVANARDGAIALHGYLFVAFCTLGVFWMIKRHYDGADPIAREEGGVLYNDGVVRAGCIASLFWGVVGFLAGLVIALQLAYPALNLDLPWTNFGRLRPVHTSAVIFAFGGNVLLATSFHVVQRTCKARLAGDWAPWFVFWGYQL